MNRIEVNVMTGEQRVVELTDAEIAEILANQPPPPTYKELRAAEFNLKSTRDQLGMMYDDAINTTTTWLDWQTEIRARIPQ